MQAQAGKDFFGGYTEANLHPIFLDLAFQIEEFYIET